MVGVSRLKGGWEQAFPAVPPQRMFDVLVDFDAYPHFIPGCLEARVLEGEDALRVETVFGSGSTRFGFTSRAVLERPGSVRIASSDGPWRAFSLDWTVVPESEGCRVVCQYVADFRSWLIAGAARLGIAELDRKAPAVLEMRAMQPLPGTT